MQSPYDSSGKKPWVTAKRTDEGFEFMVDSGGDDCYHTVPESKFDEFVVAIGQPAGTDITEAIRIALKTNVDAVVSAVHSPLTRTDFSWATP